MRDAADRWRAALESWAIPSDILAAAPQSPWGFPVALFQRAADDAEQRETPTTRRVVEALPAGGCVLDVGCGAGAASLPVVRAAGSFIGVDESADMLDAFAERLGGAGVAVTTHVGRWPDIAGDAGVGVADVAVARNVAYNVPDLAAFSAAMTEHARLRVVLELTTKHPLHWMNPLWRAIHDIDRPDRPTVEDAVAVLEERGYVVTVERWAGPSLLSSIPADEMVGFVVQRLCLGAQRADAVRAALAATPPPDEQGVATVWWESA